MARPTHRSIGSATARRIGTDLRQAELPDQRMVVLYPLVGAAVLTVIVFGLFHHRHDAARHASVGTPPAATRARDKGVTTPTSRRPTRTQATSASGTVDVPSEKGALVALPRAAVVAIDGAAGLAFGASSSSVIVVTSSPVSVTGAVTYIRDGQSEQRLVTVVRRHGAWTASNA